MKIIFTVNTYYPLRDGVQFVTQYQAEGLAKRGHDVTVVTVKYPGTKKEEIVNGVRVIRFPIETKHSFYIGKTSDYRKLILRLTENCDVLINMCMENASTELLFPILDKINCKKILYVHGMYNFSWKVSNVDSYSSKKQKVRAVLFKMWNNLRWFYDYNFNGKYIKLYDNIIQLHKLDRATLYFKKKYGLSANIIPNAVEDSFFDKADESREQNYAICVSNYLPGKNQAFILKAFYQSKAKDLGLILVGSNKNNYYNYLLRLKSNLEKKYGKKNVELMYNIPRKKVINLVKNSSMFLMSSNSEVFPISICEAISSKKPFVSTDVGITRYLPGGVLIHSPLEMSYWIDLFNENHELNKKIGEAGYQYAKLNLRIDDKVNELEKILKGE